MARGWWSRVWGLAPDEGGEPQPKRAFDPAYISPEPSEEQLAMSQLDKSITDLMSIDGATGAAIVDISSGMALASAGNPGFSLDVAAAGNSNVIRAKLNTMADLELIDEIEDILITLDSQYHLINVLKNDTGKGLFIYLVLSRTTANLALARHKLRGIATAVTV